MFWRNAVFAGFCFVSLSMGVTLCFTEVTQGDFEYRGGLR
jgi:hypothetical protein